MIHFEVQDMCVQNKGLRFLQIEKHTSRTYPFDITSKFQQIKTMTLIDLLTNYLPN
jgi:hypothetical protein